MSELRALCVTVAWNIDWPYSRNLPRAEQEAQIDQIIQTAIDNNCNAIFLQTRAFGDRLHAYENFPHKPEKWPRALKEDNTDPGWDPLETWINRCHNQGIAIYAWLNLYRTDFELRMQDDTPLPFFIDSQGQHAMLDSTSPLVEQYLLAVVDDLLAYRVPVTPGRSPFIRKRGGSTQGTGSRAAAAGQSAPAATGATTEPPDDDGIDGIVVDHYFPDPDNPGDWTDEGNMVVADGGSSEGAKATQAAKKLEPKKSILALKKSPGYQTKAENPSRLAADEIIEKIHDKVKTADLMFGVSVGKYQYDHKHANAKKWLENDWCDWFIPNMYYKSATEFEEKYERWIDANTGLKKTKIIPAYVSRAVKKPFEGTQWTVTDIASQIAFTRGKQDNRKNQRGHVHYSARALQPPPQNDPVHDLGKRLKDNEYTAALSIPQHGNKPNKPNVKRDANRDQLDLEGPKGKVFLWRIRFLDAQGDPLSSGWQRVRGSIKTVDIEPGARGVEVIMINKRHAHSDIVTKRW
jgi:uncharacterized lipoprotein YddW (UPF0748 family)